MKRSDGLMINSRPKKSVGYNRTYIAVALLFLLILADGVTTHNVGAQGSSWSTPQVMPGFDPDSWPPILIADQYGTVHAFSYQWIGDQSLDRFRAIVYNQWTLARGWTNPIDIILSPSKEARLTDVYLDGEGTFHVVFWGGDGTSADIYYSRADAWNANEVQSWSHPVLVAENAGDPEGAILAEDDLGDLLIVYHGKIYGNGVYVVKSEDRGVTWSRPAQIFQTIPTAPLVWYINVIRSTSGQLHAVWNVYNVSGQGRGIYYARSEDGIAWSDSLPLAVAQDGLGTMTPTIIEYKDSLFVVYNMPPKISMRRSMDDGLTWSDLVMLFPRHIGVNGSLSAVIDSADTLHLFFGQRISGSPDIHGMWHSTWVENRWVEPEAVMKGPQIVDRVGDKSFDPYDARAVVSQENVILVTWRTDPGLKGNGVWYSHRALDIPQLPASPPTRQPIPEPAFSLIPTDAFNNPDEIATGDPLENQPLLVDQTSPSLGRDSGTLIAMGAVPAIILILALVLLRMIRNKPL
jgi:hypothetical protein